MRGIGHYISLLINFTFVELNFIYFCDGIRQRAQDGLGVQGAERAGRLRPRGEQEEGTGQAEQGKDILENKTGHTQTFIFFFLLYLTITLATGIQYWP